MSRTTRGLDTLVSVAMLPLLVACDGDSVAQAGSTEAEAYTAPSSVHSSSVPVSGSAVHHFTTAIVHAEEPTADGKIQRSTEIIELTGDLNGYILYHPTSVFDEAAGTLVNTGTQVFSGTVAGSGPVILHDDSFRFEVDLATGETTGEVHFRRSGDAPHPGHWYDCDLVVVGTGVTPEGDGLAEYSGTCARYGSPLSYTTRPPTTVRSGAASRISSSTTSRRSRSHTTMSASIPGSSVPLMSSWNSANAGVAV